MRPVGLDRRIIDFLLDSDVADDPVASLIWEPAVDVAWDDVRADAAALARMRGVLSDAMTDGAFGLSSGLDYPPGGYATTEELAVLT